MTVTNGEGTKSGTSAVASDVQSDPTSPRST